MASASDILHMRLSFLAIQGIMSINESWRTKAKADKARWSISAVP
jgi:hypothetical protein